MFIFCVFLKYNNTFGQYKNDFHKFLNHPKTFYFSWGYHRAFFSNTDLHFRNNSPSNNKDVTGNYDFTIYNAKAKDRPDFQYLKSIKDITIPQFNASIGFVSKLNNWGMELNYNHVKYVVNENQNLRIKGYLYGDYIDTFIKLKDDFMRVEHTDGANFWMVNFTKSKLLFGKNKFIQLNNIIKFGGGVCVPRTDINFFGHQTNNKFHIAGYVYALENGLQLNFGKRFYIENSYKYAFSYFTNAKVSSYKTSYLTHKFSSFILFVNLGIKI